MSRVMRYFLSNYSLASFLLCLCSARCASITVLSLFSCTPTGLMRDSRVELAWGVTVTWWEGILFSLKKSSTMNSPLSLLLRPRYRFKSAVILWGMRWVLATCSSGSCWMRYIIAWSLISNTINWVGASLSYKIFWPPSSGSSPSATAGTPMKIYLASSYLLGNPSRMYPRLRQSFWVSLHL